MTLEDFAKYLPKKTCDNMAIPFKRHDHLLQMHGQHPKTRSNPQKKENHNFQMKFHHINEKVIVTLIT